MLPLFLNVIGILLTSIVLFAGYSWMNSVELKNGAAAIELSDRLRSLQNISGRYYYARGTYPRNLSDLEGEVDEARRAQDIEHRHGAEKEAGHIASKGLGYWRAV